MSIIACELEAERAGALRANVDRRTDHAFHGDAFRLAPADSSETARATVLYLNPPYDTDPDYSRLEHRFLLRFSQHLHAGAGFLFYLVPHYALEPSASYLASHFLELRAWRLPEPHFTVYRQVLLVGRRARRPLASAASAELILRWARNAESLPVLEERCSDPLLVRAEDETPFSLAYRLTSHDLTAAVEAFHAWRDLSVVGTSQSARQLLGARFETAMPPKPVHLALALSAGMFNGHRIEPNDPARHPPLLAKGVFERYLVPIAERSNADGDVVATVEIEKPRLALTVLRLDDYTFYRLAPGTVPAGGDDLSKWTAADLIANYGLSLAKLLGAQFPALHDPRRKEHRIALPKLARKPFRAQAEAVQAALKLLSRGRNPFLVAEVGTGKSTMALTIAGALLPEHHATTMAELRRLGLSDRVPQVERFLIVCPPHLLQSWSDQAAAVLPDLTVQIVTCPRDLLKPAQIFILSRESAKLGHGHQGLGGRCPRCGAFLATDADANAARRLRCPAVARRATNPSARLAGMLSCLLAPTCQNHPLIEDLAPAALLKRLASRPCNSFAAARCLDFFEHLLGETTSLIAAGAEEAKLLAQETVRVAKALHTASRALGALACLVAPGKEGPGGELFSCLRAVIEELEDELAAPISCDPQSELLATLEALHGAATWEESPTCQEPLYRAIAKPRRYPLAKLIQRRHARDFNLLILDEAQELNEMGSAQSKAAHRLSGLPGVPTIVLSGSLMGGFARSLFANFWALSPAFREEFRRDDQAAFVARYGFRKLLVPARKTPRQLGAHTDREIGATTIGDAPGIMQTFILRHLLPVAALVHKEDLEIKLPPLTETPVAIGFPEDDSTAQSLRSEYERLLDELLTRIRAERFDPDRAGRLFGALVEVPAYLDCATDDLPPFEIRYPEELGGELVAVGQAFPSAWRTPKERWLLARVEELRRRGDRVLVFLRHTGTPELPRRLLRLLSTITPHVAWLDTDKVPSRRREAWINEHVLARGVEILLVNPNAVRTGLNNLVAFSAGLWYELDLSATTYRQAGGRLHRIGQTRPVTIETPFYAGTAQQLTFEHIAAKVSASLRVDALDLQAALEAAGASEEETNAHAIALSLGQAVYRSLSRGR